MMGQDGLIGSTFNSLREVLFAEPGKPKSDASKNKSAGKPLKKQISNHDQLEKAPLAAAIYVYISYGILFVVGYIRDLLFGISCGRFKEVDREGYAPLFASFESFYTRHVFRRLKDVFCAPISSVPGATVELVQRESDDHFWSFRLKEEAERKTCINLGSYNYLGFAECDGLCTDAAEEEVRQSGLTNCSSRKEFGTLKIHDELEGTVARFLGTEDALTFGMGFATNSLNLPALISKGCLVLSDELNHASLILGLRLSGATVMVFKHNSVENLEKILRQAIIRGHPRTRRPWKKIFIVVEGVYSMEGTIVRLPEIIALTKKYGAYLYLDEAHSVGAMGPKGRGVVDYYGLDPKDVDIMMGTFTKSFGSAGGYIAGSKRLMDFLRVNSHAATYASSMSPPIARQIIASMQSIMGEPIDGKFMEFDGMARIRRLAKNSRYFRRKLQQKGFIVYGNDDSPVVPLLLFLPSRIRAFVNLLKERGIATVGVGFPATPIGEERARFCLSGAHTQEMLDEAVEAITEVGQSLSIIFSRRKLYSDKEIVYGDVS